MVDDRRSMFYPYEYIDVNVRSTMILLDEHCKTGVKRLVQASTRSVFGKRDEDGELLNENSSRRPINPYGASKVGADAMAHGTFTKFASNLCNLWTLRTTDMIPRILIERIRSGDVIRTFGDVTARGYIFLASLKPFCWLCNFRAAPAKMGREGGAVNLIWAHPFRPR